MIGINDIKKIKITTPEINFEKAIGADYFENLDFPEKYPAFQELESGYFNQWRTSDTPSGRIYSDQPLCAACDHSGTEG